MKLILVTLVACAFAAQDTTPPVISLTLSGLPPSAGKVAPGYSAGASAAGDSDNFHNHDVDYSNSAATECTAGATYAQCAEPSCEAHDHHDQSVECDAPKKYLIKQHAGKTYDFSKDAGKQYKTCGAKADGTVDTQCISDTERGYLAQWLLTYDAQDDSGNAAQQVTFSFVFVDLFAPTLSFATENGLNYNLGHNDYESWGDIASNFAGNLKANSASLVSFTGNKSFGRFCAVATGCPGGNTRNAWTTPTDAEKDFTEPATKSVVQRNYDLTLVAGNHDVQRYGAITNDASGDYTGEYGSNHGPERSNTKCSYTMIPVATAYDAEDYNTNAVDYRVNDGTWTASDDGTSFELDTLQTGEANTVTVDFHVEDSAGRFGYKSQSNQNLHRLEFVFTDAIAPKIYLQGYTSAFSRDAGTLNGADDHLYTHNEASHKYGKQTHTDVDAGHDDTTVTTIDICKDIDSNNACPYTTNTAVTLECGTDYTHDDNGLIDAYVEAGAYVVDNVDGWSHNNQYTPQKSTESATLSGGSTFTIGGETVDTTTTGTYTVTYDATDFNGLEAAQVSRVMTVTDRLAPRLKITGDHTIQNSAGSNKTPLDHDRDYETGNCSEEGDVTGCFGHTLYKTGFACHDQCDQSPVTTTKLFKFANDAGVDTGCDADGQLVNTAATSVQQGETDTWTFPEYETGLYAILYTCTDATGNKAEACRTIKNVDHTQPIIQILGSDNMQLEATHQGNYIDDGATCSDQVDGVISQNVEVSGDVVNLSKVGTYRITYNCKDAANRPAETAERVVTVAQTSCPTCTMECANALGSATAGKKTTVSCVQQHEASFQYTDAGAACSDVIDGATDHTCTLSFEAGVAGEPDQTADGSRDEVAAVTGTDVSCTTSQLVNADRIGTYVITYRSVNSVGKANDDETCRGGYYHYIRSVQVMDTLKPVITLKYGNTIVAQGAQATNTPKGTDEGSIGDANGNHGGNHNGVVDTPSTGIDGQAAFDSQFMAEDATTSGVNGWVLGAIASAVTGLALLGYSQRKTTVATSVPV